MSRQAQRTRSQVAAVHAAPAGSWRETWDESRIAWIALAALVTVTLGRALTIGFVPDDIGVLDSVSRGGPQRLLAGVIPGLQRVTISRDLGFWWWGTVFGLRATGFHVIALVCVVVAAVCVADATARLAGWRAGLIAAAILVLGPHAPTLVGWAASLPDSFALAASAAALALLLRRQVWLAALATLVAVASRETLFALPVLLTIAALIVPAAPPPPPKEEDDADAAPKPASSPAVRLILLAGPVILAGALALILRMALGAMPRGEAPPAHAWRLILPPGAMASIGSAFQAVPLPAILALIAAVFVVQGRRRAVAVPEPNGIAAGLGWGLAIVAGIGLFAVRRPWADVESMIAWAGFAIGFGMVLDRLHPWFARAFLVALALVQFGAHQATPLVSPADRPRPIVNLALLREGAEPVQHLGATVALLCEPLRRTPKGFLAGVAPDPMIGALLGPVARVSCRDTTLDLRLLADFRADDAWHAFLIVHGDPATGQVATEAATALIRARIGEGFLVHAHPEVAAACFEAALSERPDDPELAFPLALSLTAAGRDSAARAAWESARARGAAPAPDTLAARLLYGAPEGRVAAARGPVAAAVMAMMRDPSDSTAARALGRALLEAGAARSAAIAWAVAWGRTGAATDLVEYGAALEALDEPDMAREAYQRALTSGLPRPVYVRARARLAALGGLSGPTP